MGKGIKYIFKMLPKSVRLALIRKMVKIPEACLDNRHVVKTARSAEETNQALSLLHDCYVAKGFMHADPTGLRRSVYNDRPESTIVVVKDGDQVIGTLTLIRDGALGLPTDKYFKSENNELRQQGKNLVEVSALAVHPKYRNQGNAISLLMMKFLYHYTKAMKADQLVCTVDPRAQDFYEALWGFERKGKVIQYPLVNGSLAVYMGMELSEAAKQKNIAMFSSQDPQKNLALWVVNENVRFLFPKPLTQVLNTQITRGHQFKLVAFPSAKLKQSRAVGS